MTTQKPGYSLVYGVPETPVTPQLPEGATLIGTLFAQGQFALAAYYKADGATAIGFIQSDGPVVEVTSTTIDEVSDKLTKAMFARVRPWEDGIYFFTAEEASNALREAVDLIQGIGYIEGSHNVGGRNRWLWKYFPSFV